MSAFLNEPRVRCIVQVHSPGGWHKIVFDMDQVEEFKADPDLFAARYFRLSREDYLEWVDLDGDALCNERDKSGQPCGYRVAGSRTQLNPAEWKRLHRSGPCKRHARGHVIDC